MKRSVLLLCLSACLLLSGCAGNPVFGDDSREIDQLELVETVGFDAAGALTTVTASTAASGEPVLLKNTAETVSRAVREMQNYTDKQYIFYGHTAHVLIGEEAARQSLTRYLDYLERDSEMRLDTRLYIVQGGTAEDAITAVSDENETVGDLLASLDRDVELLSESYVFDCREVAQQLAKRNCALVAAIMLEKSENLLSSEDGMTLQSSGYAVIRDGRLLDFLDTELARGVNLLIGRTGSDVIEAPDGTGNVFAARLTESSAEYIPQFEDGRMTGLHIELLLHCNLDELRAPLDIFDGAVVQTLEESISAAALGRVQAVLERMRELDCDFCDLQTHVRQSAPLRTDRMREAWESVFSGLKCEVTVKTILERTYDVGLSPLGGWETGYAENG